MQAGKVNRLITIQKKTISHDSYGQAIEVWVDDFSTWAGIITSGGGEFYAAQKLNASTTAVFKLRFTERIKTTNRIHYGHRIFEILYPPNDVDGMRTDLFISCKEVV